ncbi:MAG: hypothetical protein M1814_002980 [Vezdaea aestivalis]|nr:MAG: hypothetical protein M1814_002980 [Vezdaea aestivalis]
MMNKYRGPADSNFITVSNCLREFVRNDQLLQHRTDEELACLRSLTSNYRGDKNRNEKRVPGTCLWVLEHPTFLDWRQNANSRLLWVSADPGCGKSVLSRSLVDEGFLINDTRKVSICYFFFKDDDFSRKTRADALSAILHQLFTQKPALLGYAIPDFKNHGRSLRTMPDALWDILWKATTDPLAGEVICLLDALDECKQSERQNLIMNLSQLFEVRSEFEVPKSLKFIVTSRPYHDIESKLCQLIDDMPSISLRGEFESEKIRKEINLVIDFQIPLLSRARRFPFQPAVQSELVRKLKSFTNRTYLWLHLIFDVIRNALDARQSHLDSLIEHIPSTVEDAYERILTRLDGSRHADGARKLLRVIVTAMRPLKLREMNLALAVDDRLKTSNICESYHELEIETEERLKERIRQTCGLFVSVIDSRIYLLHQTAKEFLVAKDTALRIDSTRSWHTGSWKHSLDVAESNFVLARICVAYLLIKEINSPKELAEELTKVTENGPFGFLKHAARYWSTYMQQASLTQNDLILSEQVCELCDVASNRFDRWYSLYGAMCDLCKEWAPRVQKITPIILASHLGLPSVVERLLRRDSSQINTPNESFTTPLTWAVRGRHIKVVRLLLNRDDINVNLPSLSRSDGTSSLGEAARKGCFETFKLLLDRNDIDVNGGKNTAISEAILGGHIEMVKLLLQRHDVEIGNMRAGDPSGCSSLLSNAASAGNIEIFKLLLNRAEIKVTSDPADRDSPLLNAARAGHWEVVNLLLEIDDSNINAGSPSPLAAAAAEGRLETVQLLLKNKKTNINEGGEETPLITAIDRGQTKVAKFLLSRGDIDTNAGDKTALYWAASNGNNEIVRLLLNRDEIQINKGRQSPLSCAAGRGNIETVKLLLCEPNININAGEPTPLSSAADYGRVEIVKLFLDREDIEINIGSSRPLQAAARSGHIQIVRLLLRRKEVEIDETHRWGTPLHQAAAGGHVQIIRLLLSVSNIDINIVNTCGATPLLEATSGQHPDAVRLLLTDDRIDINLAGSEGNTPLSMAIMAACTESVKLLLSRREIDLNRHNIRGETPFSIALKRGMFESAELLLSRSEMATDTTDREGSTPLLYAARYGNDSIAKLLLAKSPMTINVTNAHGQTPLMWAAREGHSKTVRLLLSQKDIEINLADERGQTPLSWAIRGWYVEAVEQALRKDKQLLFLDKWDILFGPGALPAWYSRKANIILKGQRIRIGSTDRFRLTPLPAVTNSDRTEITELILSKGGVVLGSQVKHNLLLLSLDEMRYHWIGAGAILIIGIIVAWGLRGSEFLTTKHID